MGAMLLAVFLNPRALEQVNLEVCLPLLLHGGMVFHRSKLNRGRGLGHESERSVSRAEEGGKLQCELLKRRGKVEQMRRALTTGRVVASS